MEKMKMRDTGTLDQWKPKNVVTKMPKVFEEWLRKNADRIAEATKRGTLPYFLRDNANFVGISEKRMEQNKIEISNLPKELKDIKFIGHYEGKEGGYLNIVQQNSNERKENLITYKILADRGGKYALLPPSDTKKSPDAFNIDKGWYSDAKNSISDNGKNVVQNAVKVANTQGVSEVVIRFSNQVSSRDLYEGLKAALYNGRAGNIKEIIIIRNNGNLLYLNVKKLRERFKK